MYKRQMIKSIQQFEESGIKKLEKIIESFMKNPKDMASFVYGIRDEVDVYKRQEKKLTRCCR